MVTLFVLPKTNGTINRLRNDIVAYYKEHQQDAHAIVDEQETSDETKLVKLFSDVLTRDQLVEIVQEEMNDIKEQEKLYKQEHPNFSPLKAAINLATKYLFETQPDEKYVTISMVQKDGKLIPEVGVVENAASWYRFTEDDLDYYIDRADYYDDFLAFLGELLATLQKQSVTEDDKDIITTYLSERRDFWMDQAQKKADQGNDASQEQLNRVVFQAFIQKVVAFPTQ
jgi:hypothetical protein